MAELRECPGCGRTDTSQVKTISEIMHIDSGEYAFAVSCLFMRGGCGFIGPRCTSEEAAITAWNTRAYDAEMEGLREENKRNIPIPPILETKDAAGKEYEFLHFRCPCCKDIHLQHFRRSREPLGLPIRMKYCVNCGQRLEWDNLDLRTEAEAALEKEANHE